MDADTATMGLFNKRQREPLVYPAVDRTVHVAASAPDVERHLAAYSDLWSPKRAEPHEVTIGSAGGWTAIRLPEAVHPWQLHNLAFWMLDCPGTPQDGAVVAESGASPHHPGYRLVRDPEIGDALCGWDDDGQGWTVMAPTNDVVRGEDVPTPRAVSVPSGYQEWHAVTVLLEDPGHGMNEQNTSNAKHRAALRDRTVFVY